MNPSQNAHNCHRKENTTAIKTSDGGREGGAGGEGGECLLISQPPAAAAGTISATALIRRLTFSPERRAALAAECHY